MCTAISPACIFMMQYLDKRADITFAHAFANIYIMYKQICSVY